METTSEHVDVQQLVENLKLASETPAKQRVSKVSVTIDQLCEHAFQHGLARASLKSIIEVVTTRTNLDQTSTTNLIKNLCPDARIPSNIVTTVISSLGQGASKPSSATQAALIKWVTTVQSVFEDQTLLYRLYAVLFNLLDNISLRTPLCHLLSMITRRRHVRPFRIQYLLELSRFAGNEHALLGLLKVYKDYYPDIIIGRTPTGRGSVPTPDPEWATRLQSILEQSSQQNSSTNGTRSGFRVHRANGRRSRGLAIPEVHTSYALESTITLEEIDSPQSFVENLEKIELPNQIISSLRDPLLQKYLHLSPSPLASARLDSWLSSYLEDELALANAGSQPSPHFSNFLDGLLSHTQSTKSILPTFEGFLKLYLPLWDGSSNFQSIFGILEYLTPQPHQDADKNYLHWAEQAASKRTDGGSKALLKMYRNLARRWMTRENLAGERVTGKAFEEVAGLIDHVHIFTQAVLSVNPTSSSLHSAILSFYEVSAHAAQAASQPGKPAPIVFPLDSVVYTLLFGSSLSDASRLCGILALSKRRFETLKDNIATYYPPTYTNRFNGHLMDLCNLFWRNRALNSGDKNALACLCPESTRVAIQAYMPSVEKDYSALTSFGLSQHYQLCAIAIATLRVSEDAAEAEGKTLQARHAGPPTQRSLQRLEKEGGLAVDWKMYRVRVLEALQLRGLGGIKDLMFSTMSNLRATAAK